MMLSSTAAPKTEGYTKCDEIPFDFERKRLSVVVERQSQRILITKGAPEGIFPLLSGYEMDGKEDTHWRRGRQAHPQTSSELNSQGYRSLAVAYAEVPARADYSVKDERNLILAGFLTFSDTACRTPPRSWIRSNRMASKSRSSPATTTL